MPLAPGLLPPFPDIFSGSVTVAGQPAADGLSLYVQVGYWRSQPILTSGGRYFRLQIGHSDWSLDGKTARFYLEGVEAEQTAVYDGRLLQTPVLDLTFPGPLP